MMMLLSILCAGALVLAVLFAMLETIEPQEQRAAELEIPAQPGRFFATRAVSDVPANDLALHIMLAQIERHVRLEQAAAECFLAMPSPEALGSRTASPLAN